MAEKILVIDDDAAVARTIGRILGGYDTSTETDPRQAVARIAAGERFDLILCDLRMPGMSGEAVFEAVRRDHRGRQPLMLMMSGEVNVKSIYAAGCAVLFKPFGEAELKNLVAALLHKDMNGASAPAPR